MTVITIVATGNVRSVLSSCRDAIVTGATGAEHLRVVDGHYWLKRYGAMAVLANVCCLHVGGTLADGAGAIVATDAVRNDICVVEDGWQPGRHIVAVIALVPGRYVTRRFPGRLKAVVTADAASRDGRVIHVRDDGPICSYVAIRTFADCRNMVSRFC